MLLREDGRLSLTVYLGIAVGIGAIAIAALRRLALTAQIMQVAVFAHTYGS